MNFMNFKTFRLVVEALWALFAINCVAQQLPQPVMAATAPAAAVAPADARSLNDWLLRMHEASRNQSYTATFVLSSGASMASAKIWHVCQGGQQMERLDTLTGAPRSSFRHNDQVITFMPEQKVARSEKRESLGLFPERFPSADSRIADFYRVRPEGSGRVAGVEADIIVLIPRDTMRFGYRVWAERKSGLVVKLQTLDLDGKVLEQAAFSELQLDAPVKMDKLMQMMARVEGYRIEKPVRIKTTASAEGWILKTPVAGFSAMSCYKRPASAAAVPAAEGEEPLQWIFSDGLASVSIFIEPFDRQRHLQESSLSLGATQTLTRQLDAYWITVMGEVPLSTLRIFASGLAHKK